MSTNQTTLFALGFSALALLMGAATAFPQSGPQLHMQEVFPLERQVRGLAPSVVPERHDGTALWRKANEA